MNSVSLVLAMVLFLSSGLGVYAGFFILGGSAQFKAAPPRPSSIVSFTIVVFGSVLTHAVASTLAFWLDRGHASWALAHLNHSPNPYEMALQLTADPKSVSGSAISYLLFWTAVIPIIATLLAWGTSYLFLRQRSIASFFYGWMEPIVRQAAPDENWVVAFVVTRITIGDHLVGYEGTVKEVTIDPDKQLTSITLVDVERFLLGRQGRSLRRQTPLESVPKIETLHIPSDRIENTAFTTFAIVEE